MGCQKNNDDFVLLTPPPTPPPTPTHPQLLPGLLMCHFCFDFILFELTGYTNFDFN